MKVLVDYDNLPAKASNWGLANLADRLLERISTVTEIPQSVEFRLYGGWDRNNRMTRIGQELSTQIRSVFPRTLRIGTNPAILNMALAQALEALPNKRLACTLREEPMRKIKCQVPSKTTCRNNPCPIDPMAAFLNEGRCSVENCIAEPKMLLSRQEQKLVDTMIVADMIHLAHCGHVCLALVSSDDDMWPGILSALTLGTKVIHIQTRVDTSSTVYLTKTSAAYEKVGF